MDGVTDVTDGLIYGTHSQSIRHIRYKIRCHLYPFLNRPFKQALGTEE